VSIGRQSKVSVTIDHTFHYFSLREVSKSNCRAPTGDIALSPWVFASAIDRFRTLKKGRAQTMTHDYRRNGTTTLFAALDVKTGKVIGECVTARKEFIRFLKTIDRAVAKGDRPMAAIGRQ
jgi:hypothetical protein